MSARVALNVTAQTLIDVGRDPLVVVDFAHFAARNALSDLLRQDRHRGLHRIDVVTALGATLADHSLAEVAQAYTDDLERRHIRPATILGYCSAAALAVDLWQRHNSRGGHANLILVEPTWLTPDLILADLQAARAGLGVGDDRAWAGPVGQEAIVGRLHADLVEKLRADGLPDVEIDMCASVLLDRYRAWFGFLFATLDLGTPQIMDKVTLLIGADSAAVPASTWDASMAEVVRLGVPTSELLSSQETVTAIEALAAGRVMAA